MAPRLAGVVRLVHPFPSVLDGVVSGAVAVLAGATPDLAFRLGLAMTALQFGIGATNDLIDAPRDAGHKPRKPIPTGLVSRRAAVAIAAGSFAVGLGLAAMTGFPVLVLAVVVIGIGLAYDLRLKGTAWSWLPFAIGIPILPVFGWLGATATLPRAFVLLVPAAVAAGAALAIANTLADVERDRAAGAESIATALGPGRAWWVGAGLVVGVVAIAIASAAAFAGASPRTLLVAVTAVLPIAGLAIGRSGGAAVRERAWQLQAVGMAGVGIAWIWTLLG